MCNLFLPPATAALTRAQLPYLPRTGDLLRLLRVGANKAMSQNFILDMNVNRRVRPACVYVRTCAQIVRIMPAPVKDAHICEVGPGPGGITRALLENDCLSLTGIEIDRRFFPMLELLRDATGDRFNIVHGDVLKFDWDTLWPSTVCGADWLDEEQLPNTQIVGNLPFSVATPLMIRLLCDMSYRRGAFAVGRTPVTVTLQREVGQRCVAPLNGYQRCRLSVMCQYLAHVKVPHIIRRASFTPRPEVDAAVVTFVPRSVPLIQQPFELVEKVVRQLFHYRQKYSVRGYADLYPKEIRREMAHEVFSQLGIEPTHKCTQLGMAEVKVLCDMYAHQCRKTPGLFLYDYVNNNRLLSELADLEGARAPTRTPCFAAGAMPPEYPFTDLPPPSHGDMLKADIENASIRNKT